MLWTPQKGLWLQQDNVGSVGSETIGTTVTTGASASTKGTPVELIAAADFDAYWLTIMASNYANTATASEGSLDILVGTATEEILIADLLMGNCNRVGVTGRGPKIWQFPLYIPAGTRIAAQAAGVRTSIGVNVAVFLHGGNGVPPFRVGSKVRTYGMGTVPNGTAITPGASGAQGSFTQIVAATDEDHFAFVPSFQCSVDTTMNPRAIRLGMGVGAATEEEIGSWWFWTDSIEATDGPHPAMPVFHDVPAGTRLTLRGSNSGTNDSNYDAVIHAVS